MSETPKLVLASNSPRRKELLSLGGWAFSVQPARIDETPIPGEGAREYVLRMAEEKARAAAERVPFDSLVLGADTIVINPLPIGEQILGKPADEAEAIEMLRQLHGRWHEVYTAIAVLRLRDGKLAKDACITRVKMRNYSEAELLAYVSSGDPLDKAGAYAIQNEAFHPVERLDGCYANVVGLPICHVARNLKQFGVTPPAAAEQACESRLGYDCPICEQVLREEPK